MNAPMQITPGIVNLSHLAFRRLDADGNELATDATTHAITHFPALGLMFDVRKPKTVNSLKAAQAHAKKCDLLGRKGEWVIGNDVETAVLIDRDFDEPAVNPLVAPNMPSNGWIYISKPVACSSACVWFVDLRYGNVDWCNDDGGRACGPGPARAAQSVI